MKRKILLFFAAIVCLFCLVAGVAACGGNEVPPETEHTHSWGAWQTVMEPTCTEDGLEQRFCTECGNDETRPISATGHEWSEWYIYAAASCEDEGEERRDCAHCDEFETRTIAKTEHIWSDWYAESEPTCSRDGLNVRYCEACNERDEQVITAVEHSFTNYIKNTLPTCTENGTKIAYCDYDCGTTDIIEIEDSAFGHDILYADGKEPTCEDPGWEDYQYCARMNCDYTTYHEIPALGHDFIHHEGQAATCTEDGWEAYDTCSRCYYTTYKAISATGHSHEEQWTYDEAYHWYKTTCEHADVKVDYAEHDFVNRVCSVCGYKVDYTPGLIFTLNEDGTAYSVSAGELQESEVEIPSQYRGLPVTEIGSRAFYGDEITGVIIPDSVTSIGINAFRNCTHLTAVEIGKSVTSINNYAFSACQSLRSIVIPDNVLYVYQSAFAYCRGLTELTIGAGVDYIGREAFSECNALTTIYYNATAAKDQSQLNDIFSNAGIAGEGITLYVGKNVRSIPAYLFVPGYVVNSYPESQIIVNHKLTGVVFAEGGVCESIGYAAFAGCVELASINLPEGLKTIGDNAFDSCGKLTVLDIPQTVSEIGSSAFYKCASLKSVVLPAGLTELNYHTFGKCSSLESITIPESVTKLGSQIFDSCTMLKEVKYNAVNAAMDSSSSNMFTNAGTESGGITLTVGALVEAIPDNFCYNKYYDDAVKYIVFAQNSICKTIGNNAFKDMRSLISVNIPESVTYIGHSAFDGCTVLKEVNFNAAECRTDEDVVSITIFAEAGSEGEGIKVKVGAAVKQLPAYLFSEAKVVSVEFEAGSVCESIGKLTFYSCGIESIIIPASIKEISSYAFWDCSALTEVTFERPSGWTVTKVVGKVSEISSADLLDKALAAQYLAETYFNYTWKHS